MDFLNEVRMNGKILTVPDIRYMPSGTKITAFRLEVGSQVKKRDGSDIVLTDSFNVQAIGDWFGADVIALGNEVFVIGRIKNRSWVSKHDGLRKFMTEIDASDVKLLSKAQTVIPFEASQDKVEDDIEIPF